MDDLINRSAVLEIIDAGSYDTGYSSEYEELVGKIKDIPAVDAVPVVRCNMCKYYEQDTGFCQYFGGGNHWDGFCNNGARMDTEEG